MQQWDQARHLSMHSGIALGAVNDLINQSMPMILHMDLVYTFACVCAMSSSFAVHHDNLAAGD